MGVARVGSRPCALGQRMRVKTAIAEAAGVDPRHEIERARRAGVLSPRTRFNETGGSPRRGLSTSGDSCRNRQPESQQLAIR
ncbi:hypothetical protein [Rhodococcus olei]|uniref:hypothetical protein n=1 Tax=Rhodococcus olei TaxID=2161675 RepID=UPI0031EF0D1C